MSAPASSPEISVVVPSHDRPLRLRWLLNALEEQTLDRSRWEVIVAHDSAGAETNELLATHPLAREGMLRSIALEPGTAPPGRNRNAGWRVARAPVIAFTDDDCRPAEDWLERALEAVGRHPGAVIQGATRPDPVEHVISDHAPRIRTQSIRPPRPWAQACNIVYPRALLETVGGFPEDMYVGEDASLAQRTSAIGAPYVGAQELLVYHAIDELSVLDAIRGAWRWRGLPLLIRRHPELRREFPLWLFWQREHVWLPFAIAAWFLERRNRAWGLLAVPWMIHALPRHHGTHPGGRLRALSEAPSTFAIGLAQMLTLLWGSIKHRCLFL